MKPCIESIYTNFKDIRYEIIVVDNASVDGSTEKIKQFFPEIILIKNEQNLGFARANNIAIERSKGNYVFLLNADTLILNSEIKKALEYFDCNPETGMVGPQQQNDRGPIAAFSMNKTFKEHKKQMLLDALYLNRLNIKKRVELETIQQVGYINGAAMLIRKDVFDKIGLFDERFFFMGEEVDFAFRCHQAGFQVVYFPFLKILHYGASGKGLTLWGLMQYHYSNFKLFEKYSSSKAVVSFYFTIWLITRSIYSFISVVLLKNAKANLYRLKIYFKALVWYFSFGKIKFAVQYR